MQLVKCRIVLSILLRAKRRYQNLLEEIISIIDQEELDEYIIKNKRFSNIVTKKIFNKKKMHWIN